jgi:hypothetical protein
MAGWWPVSVSAQFRQSPPLHSFLDELMWIHPPVGVVPATGTPHQQTEELCAALELIQLMQEVFMDLSQYTWTAVLSTRMSLRLNLRISIMLSSRA